MPVQLLPGVNPNAVEGPAAGAAASPSIAIVPAVTPTPVGEDGKRTGMVFDFARQTPAPAASAPSKKNLILLALALLLGAGLWYLLKKA